MRLLRALLLGLLALGVCSSLSTAEETQAAPGKGHLQRILESRELRVGLTGNQPPLNMKNKSGEIIGLEVELVEALADAMGLSVRFVEKPFAQLLPALETGEVDLVISGMTITPERNARVAFAGPYFISGKSVLTNAAAISNVESSDELDVPERTYAALAGSTSETFVKAVFPRAKLVATSDYDSAVQMVIDDKVDALIADFPICVLSVMRFPEADLSTLVTPFTLEPLGIALPPGDPLFVNLVENYLGTLEKTGLLAQLKAKWFSRGDWVSELP